MKSVMQGPGILFAPYLEEEFISAVGWCAIYLHSSGEERYSQLLSEAFGLDPGDIADPFFRDCFERIRTLALGEKGFGWRVLRYELVEAGHAYDSHHIRLIDLICSDGGRPYEIPALRKRLEEMAARRRQADEPTKGWKEKTYSA